MNSFKLLSFVLSILLFSISCSKSEDPVVSNFIINQSIVDIQELDQVNFAITATNSATPVESVNWFIDDVSTVNDLGFLYTFNDFGNFVIKANIQYYNEAGILEMTEATKNVTVTERPKYKVNINTIEVTAFEAFPEFIYNFSNSFCSLKAYFELREKDEFGGITIPHTSSENIDNLDVSVNNFQAMTWDISNLNYEVVVYQSDNLYPNDQGYYHFHMVSYGLNGMNGTTFDQIDDYYFDLNPHRGTRPSEIIFNTNTMTIKLGVEWN